MLIYLCIFDWLFWYTKTTGAILVRNQDRTTKTIQILLVYSPVVFSKPTGLVGKI